MRFKNIVTIRCFTWNILCVHSKRGACSNGRDEGEVVEKIENSDIIVPKKG